MRGIISSRKQLAFFLTFAALLPFGKLWTFWKAYFRAGPVQSWDGSGHFSILKIYDQRIFPDVFGWTRNYFGGMAFPNSYPPLWYWLISVLHHVGLPLELTAKVTILLSMAAIPLALGMLAWVTTRSQTTVLAAALLCAFPLLDRRMLPHTSGGLNFYSTFTDGIYTEPLGFLCFAGLVALVLRPARSHTVDVVRQSLVGSLALLCNFFAFIFCLPFLAADVILRSPEEAQKQRLLKLMSVLVLVCGLTAFWAVPVLTNYRYFVTLPVRSPWGDMVSTYAWLWLELGVLSSFWCFRTLGRPMRVFLAGILFLGLAAACTGIPGTHALPLQLPRFVAVLVLLLTIPIAQAVAALTRAFMGTLFPGQMSARSKGVVVALSFLIAPLILTPPRLDPELYSDENSAKDLQNIFAFGRSHPDGRYLVLMPHSHAERFLARAVTSYLGEQRNEAGTTVFREASPSSLFYIPLQNAFSDVPLAFGISSSLANDVDFLSEPWSQRLQQARELNIHYVVSSRPIPLGSERSVIAHQLDNWIIYELPAPADQIEALAYLPALVVGRASFKERRSEDVDFVRLAEEQFRSGDYAVRLVLSPTESIDSQPDPSHFGALILNDCNYGNSQTALASVRAFARDRLVIVLSDASPACQRLSENIADLPKMITIMDDGRGENVWLDGGGTVHLANTGPIRIWSQIRVALNAYKVAAPSATAPIYRPSVDSQIAFSTGFPAASAPYLIRQTYSPYWRRDDNAPVYLCGPTSMVTFSAKDTALTFKRGPLEHMAAWLSVFSAVAVTLGALRFYRIRFVLLR